MTQRNKKILLEDVEGGDLEAGLILLQKNNWWEALNTFLNTLKTDPSNSVALAGYGIALSKTGQMEKAHEFLLKSFEDTPTPQIRIALALAFAESSRFEEAINILDGLDDSGKSLLEALEIRSVSLLHLGKVDEAKPLLETVMSVSPQYTAALLNLGLVLAIGGDPFAGQEKAAAALEAHKQLGDPVRVLGLDAVQYRASGVLADRLLERVANEEIDEGLAYLFHFAGCIFMRRDDTERATRLLEAAASGPAAADHHLALAVLRKSVWDFVAAESHARTAVQLSKDDKEISDFARNLLAENMVLKYHTHDERKNAHGVKAYEERFLTHDIKAQHYPGIAVLFTHDLNGGGIRLADDYLDFVRERYGRVGNLYEWCSGPGFLGYAMLAHNLAENLCLADINPKAVFYSEKTRTDNCLEDRVNIYHSDNLDSIPDHEKWDLVIGNPPHYGGTSDYYSEIDRRGLDRDWRLHRRFFETVGPHLKPDGRLCIIEWDDPTVDYSSTPETFRPMLEENGLVLEDAVKSKTIDDHYYLIARKK